MLIRRAIASVAITFNIASVLVLALLMRLPDAQLWMRNTLFVSTRTLAELELEVARPPKGLAAASPSSGNKHGSSLEARIKELCRGGATDCAPKSLAAHLASLERTGGCGTYGTQADLVEGVLAGGGCCSDVVKTFLILAPNLGFAAREVHIPSHTTAEVWNESIRRWIWIDPFIGYQAFGNDRPLSHLDIYQRFTEGSSVQFSLIQSRLPGAIPPTSNYPGYRPTAFQAIFYTSASSLERSAAFGDWLADTPLPKPVRELLLYLTVKPPLLATASGFNLFLLLMARSAALAWLLAWLSSSLILIVLAFDRCKPAIAASQGNLETVKGSCDA
jgi:hypothetical protein